MGHARHRKTSAASNTRGGWKRTRILARGLETNPQARAGVRLRALPRPQERASRFVKFIEISVPTVPPHASHVSCASPTTTTRTRFGLRATPNPRAERVGYVVSARPSGAGRGTQLRRTFQFSASKWPDRKMNFTRCLFNHCNESCFITQQGAHGCTSDGRHSREE
jgi:hypothetical protein